jgi:hypothetical protein
MRPTAHSNGIKWLAGTSVVAFCLIVSAGSSAAAPSGAGVSVAERPARVETALGANADAAVLARETKTRDALGFPVGVSRIGRHVHDGLEQTEYDEVTELDAHGRPQALTQFDMNGQLRSAVRFDAPSAGAVKVTRDAAVKSAQRSISAAGLSAGAVSSTEADVAAGGWTVHWARLVDGVRVRGDETRVHIWANGRIQSVARAEHDLAAAPGNRMDAAAGRQIATSTVASWLAGHDSSYTVQKTALEWVGPNAAFDPAKLTSAEAPYRLAWVTEVVPTGTAAQTFWRISLFIDAADGSLIGGDFVE